MRTELPTKPNLNECGIINTDDASGPGTHWVAYKKSDHTVFYFDSFGDLKPPLEVQKYFKNCKIYYNHQHFQTYKESNCGQLCVKFLKHVSHNHNDK